MAATISGLDFSVAGDKRRTLGTVTGDTAYPTGGYSITPNQVGLGTILALNIELPLNISSGTAVDAARYRISTSKLQFFDFAGAEVANGTDLSTFAARFEAIGW